MTSDPAGRPDLAPLLAKVTREIVGAAPSALGHIDPSAILFVAGAARRESRASVRPLSFGGAPVQRTSKDGRWRKPQITVDGLEILYEICLRPLFFLASSPRARAETLVHELLHVSPHFDGTLDPRRSHRCSGGGHPAGEIQEIVAAWLAMASPSTHGWLAHQGELRLKAWLCRPPSKAPANARIRWAYDERDLFSAMVEQA